MAWKDTSDRATGRHRERITQPILMKNKKLPSPKRLKHDDSFAPYPTQDGDELFPNGFFVFNISKLIEYLHGEESNVPLGELQLDGFPGHSRSVNESPVDSVDLNKPVILAEIAPGRYNSIDGNHRIEKARRAGISTLPCYQLDVTEHIRFLTSREAYDAYVEYWNDKL